ncbi:MAG: hypothetical protein IPK87_14620 [Planctomycetes bacterium]|nr:hypothetical protein [Planctomycetota bacterium]
MIEYVTTHGAPALSRWDLHGASRDNTDNGRAWVRVKRNGNDHTVTMYRDAQRTLAVAAGTLDSSSGELALAALNDSGLDGSVRLHDAAPCDALIDIFYACDTDLLARHAGLAAFLDDGNFAGREGFSEPCLRAKRLIDALINARLPVGWLADDLVPLAEATSLYALQFTYDYLSIRADDPAAQLALRWRNAARESLSRIRLPLGGSAEQIFVPRLIRT